MQQELAITDEHVTAWVNRLSRQTDKVSKKLYKSIKNDIEAGTLEYGEAYRCFQNDLYEAIEDFYDWRAFDEYVVSHTFKEAVGKFMPQCQNERKVYLIDKEVFYSTLAHMIISIRVSRCEHLITQTFSFNWEHPKPPAPKHNISVNEDLTYK